MSGRRSIWRLITGVMGDQRSLTGTSAACSRRPSLDERRLFHILHAGATASSHSRSFHQVRHSAVEFVDHTIGLSSLPEIAYALARVRSLSANIRGLRRRDHHIAYRSDCSRTEVVSIKMLACPRHMHLFFLLPPQSLDQDGTY